ncbi:MAG: VTT domain-containing protein [Gammaproteobacteria bacterium]|nr:VTT domain-containing protein [Gammaproteobacteria bacterium]
MTLLGGAFLGSLVATFVIVPAATLGAIVPYLAAKILFKDMVQHTYQKQLRRVNEGIRDSGWWFLLSARLNPIIPFVALNLVSGLANISLRQYVSATFLGIIPAVIVSTNVGSQIGLSLEKGTALRPGLFFALLLLAVTPLIVRYVQKKWLSKKGASHE